MTIWLCIVVLSTCIPSLAAPLLLEGLIVVSRYVTIGLCTRVVPEIRRLLL